jgi:hypothetical protein
MTAPRKTRESKKVPEPHVIYAKNGNGNGGDWSQKYGSVLQTVMVLAIPFTALWVGAIAPLQSSQEKLLTIREFEEYRRNGDTYHKNVDAELLRLRALLVTRDEQAKFEMNNASRLEGQANRLLTIENELHSTGLGKALDRMQSHIEELDRRVLSVVKDQPKTP